MVARRWCFFSPFISYSRPANHSVVTNRLASSETRQFCSLSDSEQESVKTQPGVGGARGRNQCGLLIFRKSEMEGDKVRRWRERKMEKGKERRAK